MTTQSNYIYPESAAVYDLSLRLYEGLSKGLNYNVMFSQRGLMTLFHSEPEKEIALRGANAMQLNKTDDDISSVDGVRKRAPISNFRRDARFPIEGAVMPVSGIVFLAIGPF